MGTGVAFVSEAATIGKNIGATFRAGDEFLSMAEGVAGKSAGKFGSMLGAAEGEVGSLFAKGSGIIDDAFFHVTPTKYESTILEKGLDPEISGFVTKGKYINDITDSKIFETKLYSQDLWPETAGRFSKGASILQIDSPFKPSFYSPFTNNINGVPQWLFEGEGRLPAILIKRLGGY